MKITFLSGSYLPNVGGTEVLTYELTKRLVRDNDVSLITSRLKGQKALEVIGGLEIHRIPIIDKNNLRLGSYGISAFFRSNTIEKSDIIHSVMAFPAGIIAAHMGKMYNKPTITTVTGGDLCDYPEVTGKYKFFLRPLIRWGLKNTTKIHAISKWTSDLVERLSGKNATIIYPGVDTKRFKPKKVTRDGDPFIVSISRLTEKNGLEYLIRAMPEVLKEFPKARLRIYGEGQEYVKLNNLINRLYLSRSVELSKSMNYWELHKAYQGSDLFVRPSLHEGFGISFLESMSCGVPPIGTSIEAIPEIIQEERNGMLVKPKQSSALSQTIIYVLSDKYLQKKLVKNGIKFSSGFDWEIVYKKVHALYNEISPI